MRRLRRYVINAGLRTVDGYAGITVDSRGNDSSTLLAANGTGWLLNPR